MAISPGGRMARDIFKAAICGLALIGLTSISRAQPNDDIWRVEVFTDPSRVEVTAASDDGGITFAGGCNKAFGQGFLGGFHGYQGIALQRIDENSEPVTFEISGDNGTDVFDAALYYFEPDDAWMIDGPLPVAFYDTFAHGSLLTISIPAGEVFATFGLTGSAHAIAMAREVCGF